MEGKFYYRGVDIETPTKEELCAALKEAAYLWGETSERLKDLHNFYGAENERGE